MVWNQAWVRPRIYCRSIRIVLIAVCLLCSAPGCLFRGKKAAVPEVPPVPSRMALLPMAVPEENADSRWLALATPILLAKSMELSPDLELVPIWQSLPITVEALGQSRSVTPDIATYVASRVAAKWAMSGEFSTSQGELTMLLDFFPARPTIVPYRYNEPVRVAELPIHLHEATSQFLRYLAVRPLPEHKSGTATESFREIAQALDREYGWFVAAEPGKAQKVVSELLRSDIELARLLFNPSLYPELAPAGTRPRPVELKPPIASPEPAPAIPPTPPQAPPPRAAVQPAATESPPQTPASQWRQTSSTDLPVKPPPTGTLAKIFGKELERSSTRAVTPKHANPAGFAARGLIAAEAPIPLAAEPPASPAAEEGVPTSLPRPLEGAYRIQVLATRSQNAGIALVQKLRDLGLSPDLEKADIPEKGILYRVRLSGYRTRRLAIEAGEMLRLAGVIQDFWLIH